MTRQHSISEARKDLSSLVREAESGKAVQLTRRGEPVAVLLGRRQYERLTSYRPRFSQAYEDFAREVDLEELALDPDELFAGARENLQGREVEL